MTCICTPDVSLSDNSPASRPRMSTDQRVMMLLAYQSVLAAIVCSSVGVDDNRFRQTKPRLQCSGIKDHIFEDNPCTAILAPRAAHVRDPCSLRSDVLEHRAKMFAHTCVVKQRSRTVRLTHIAIVDREILAQFARPMMFWSEILRQ